MSKKTNVEIYAEGFYTDSFKNAIPGTVLDNGITSAKLGEGQPVQEFFLVSTSQNLGISKPSKYTVMYDSVGEDK